MKKKCLAVLAAVALFGVGNAISNNNFNAQTVEAKKAKKAKTYKAYTTDKSIVYKDKTGTMRITSVKGVKHKENGKVDDEEIHIYGTFTNNSSKSLKPENFFSDHFYCYQTTKNSLHEVEYLESDCDYRILSNDYDLTDNAEDYTLPHHTVKFMLADNDDIRTINNGQKFTLRAHNTYSSKKLASKNFYLSNIKTINDSDDEDDD